MSGKFWDRGPIVVTGCTKVSEGCKNCWSERAHVIRAARKDKPEAWPADCLTEKRFNGTVHFRLDALEQAAKGRKPRVIAIWNDLYHEGVTDEQRDWAFGAMALSPQHVFLIVTKRPERAEKYHTSDPDIGRWGYIDGRAKRLYRERTGKFFPPGKMLLGPLPHIWHIVTAENQERAHERIPHLLNIPGKRGLIIEPMLGAVDIAYALPHEFNKEPHCPWCENCIPNGGSSDYWKQRTADNHAAFIHQVILGPENGPGKRHMEESWAQSVEEQCRAAGVPFYRKDQERGELAWRMMP